MPPYYRPAFTTTEKDTTENNGGDFDAGDLERLFAEDTETRVRRFKKFFKKRKQKKLKLYQWQPQLIRR